MKVSCFLRGSFLPAITLNHFLLFEKFFPATCAGWRRREALSTSMEETHLTLQIKLFLYSSFAEFIWSTIYHVPVGENVMAFLYWAGYPPKHAEETK